MNRNERRRLMDELLSGSISERDRLRLEAELIVDPQVRREYYQQVELQVLLEQESQLAEESPLVVGSPLFGTTFLNRLAVGAFVAIAASFVTASLLRSPSANPTLTTSAASASGFAVLQSQDEAVWLDQAFLEGDVLPAGELRLKSGYAHVELFNGVEVILEGDATFSIDSSMQITLMRGIARAKVPEPAKGFRIRTASGDVVDLGTEFNVEVDKSGADVVVLDGEVELHPSASEILRLDAGESRRLSGRAGIIPADSTPNLTLGLAQLNDRIQRKRESRKSTWHQWQENVNADPRLIAHYRFSTPQPSTRMVENLATQHVDAGSDGTVVALPKRPTAGGKTTMPWISARSAVEFE